MYEFQMWNRWTIEWLIEEWLCVDCVQGVFVGSGGSIALALSL